MQAPLAEIVAVLQNLEALRRDLDRLEYTVMRLLRASGATWEQIGDELGISRQHARRRYDQLQKRQAPR